MNLKTINFRKCKCFKRDKESDDEDLTMSTQFQKFLDDISTDEESEDSIQNMSISSISENNLSDLEFETVYDNPDYFWSNYNNKLVISVWIT